MDSGVRTGGGRPGGANKPGGTGGSPGGIAGAGAGDNGAGSGGELERDRSGAPEPTSDSTPAGDTGLAGDAARSLRLLNFAVLGGLAGRCGNDAMAGVTGRDEEATDGVFATMVAVVRFSLVGSTVLAAEEPARCWRVVVGAARR